MPSTPTVQAGLLPVPGDTPDAPIVVMDLDLDNLHLLALSAQEHRLLRVAALEQLRTEGLHPIPVGAYVPGPGAGRTWTAHLSPGRLQVRSPQYLVYDGTMATWPAYTEAVTANGWVLFYAGHLALGPDADALQAMREAAERGEVLGGVVPAKVTQQAPGPVGEHR